MSFSYIGKIGTALESIIGSPKNFAFGLIWSFIVWILLLLAMTVSVIPLLPALAGATVPETGDMGQIDMTPFLMVYLAVIVFFVLLKPIGDLSSFVYASASINKKSMGFMEFIDHAKEKFVPLLLANLLLILAGIALIVVTTIIFSLVASFSSDPVVINALSFALMILPFLFFFSIVSPYLPFVFMHKKLEHGIIGSFFHCIRLSLPQTLKILPLVVLISLWNYFVLLVADMPFCIGGVVASLALSFLGWYVLNYILMLVLSEASGHPKVNEIKKDAYKVKKR